MRRKDAIEAIIASLNGDEAVVSSTGLISRQMFQLDNSEKHFYMTGSLGLASSIGLGITVSQPEKRTLVVDGDAALLMNLGTLITVGYFSPPNLIHIVLDNEAYASCSEEPSFSSNVSLEDLALIAGYRSSKTVTQEKQLASVLKTFLEEAGPSLILAKIELGGRRDLPRPLDLPQIQRRFKKYLNRKENRENNTTNILKTKDCGIKERKLIEKLRFLLKKFQNKKNQDFSGLGVVIYHSDRLPTSAHFSIRPSIRFPKGLQITAKECLELLNQASRSSNPIHDGFIFFNQEGELTHLAQYFVPPVVPGIVPNRSHGIRYHSAQFGSCLEGVIATGIVCANLNSYYFVKGEAYLVE